MRLYKLTKTEIGIINKLNSQQVNKQLVICDYGDGNIGVDPDALQNFEFRHYLKALVDEHAQHLENIKMIYKEARVVEISLKAIGSIDKSVRF